MLPESRLQKRGPAKHPSAATSVQIHSVGSGSLKIAACRFEAFSHMHPRHKGKPILYLFCFHYAHGSGLPSAAASCFHSCVWTLPFIFGQLSFYSAHLPHCSWSAVSQLHLLLFHYKQHQAAAGTHLGQWEIRSVKPMPASGRLGQVTILLMTRLQAKLAASCIRLVKWRGMQVLRFMTTSCHSDRVWSPHPYNAGTYRCLFYSGYR